MIITKCILAPLFFTHSLTCSVTIFTLNKDVKHSVKHCDYTQKLVSLASLFKHWFQIYFNASFKKCFKNNQFKVY